MSLTEPRTEAGRVAELHEWAHDPNGDDEEWAPVRRPTFRAIEAEAARDAEIERLTRIEAAATVTVKTWDGAIKALIERDAPPAQEEIGWIADAVRNLRAALDSGTVSEP